MWAWRSSPSPNEQTPRVLERSLKPPESSTSLVAFLFGACAQGASNHCMPYVRGTQGTRNAQDNTEGIHLGCRQWAYALKGSKMIQPFALRKKWQRYDKHLLPMFLCEFAPGIAVATPPGENPGPPHKLEYLGPFEGYDGFGSSTKFDFLAVTTPEGVVVPAYRVSSLDNRYCICQRFTHKAIK